MPVVVVESPAKAKTINKYLGAGYTVLASYGHVRDLPPKDGSVDTENGFDMTWEMNFSIFSDYVARLFDQNGSVVTMGNSFFFNFLCITQMKSHAIALCCIKQGLSAVAGN